MGVSKYYQENPDEFRAYNRDRLEKYRWEHPDKVHQYKENEKQHQAEYREKHREEKNIKQNSLNDETLRYAVNNGKWSDDELKHLERMIIDGKSYMDIARILERSYRSVCWAKRKYFNHLTTAYKKVNYIPKDK